MSKDEAMGLITTIFSIEKLSMTAKALLITLHCHTDSENKCWLSDYEISRLLKMKEKSIQKPLRELIQEKLVKRTYDNTRKRYLTPFGYEWDKPLEEAQTEL